MAHPLIDEHDLKFQLYNVLDVESLTARSRYADHGRDTFDGAIETAHAIARDHFQPINALMDREEPRIGDDGKVVLPEAAAPALRQFIDAGFMAAGFDAEWGGMQLPYVVTQACFAHFKAANIALSGYPFLTMGAANLLNAHGSQEQKALYMAPMLEGRYFGTMCLSEPQAGSSLSDIRTRAEPADDGSYRIAGTKMWISGGEQELSENIVHLVLAKIPGGPPGVKGVSLFIVPKYRVEADGSLGPRNDVQLAGLNHKMGYRGTTNTLLSFGEDGECVGYLVGEPHQGLACMFHMMNEARIGVGMGATMLGYAGYQVSLQYARERPQGRHPDGKDATTPQVPIVEHADIRRLLLAQKAAVEGALALCLYAARLVDEKNTADDAAARERAHLLLEVLTPVCKAWPSDWCLEANKHAIQILGGYGYTREFPVEQYYRDNRLNPIHEGTNGIQAMDLLGRKVTMQGGAGLQAVMEEIARDVAAARELPEIVGLTSRLETVAQLVADTTRAMGERAGGDVRLYLANASVYLDLFGHMAIAWMWLRQAAAAARAKEASTGDAVFHDGKIAAAHYFFRYELIKAEPWAELLASLDDTTLMAPEAGF